MITDAAFNRLIAIYEQDRILWAAAHVMDRRSGSVGLRKLARAHGINPNA